MHPMFMMKKLLIVIKKSFLMMNLSVNIRSRRNRKRVARRSSSRGKKKLKKERLLKMQMLMAQIEGDKVEIIRDLEIKVVSRGIVRIMIILNLKNKKYIIKVIIHKLNTSQNMVANNNKTRIYLITIQQFHKETITINKINFNNQSNSQSKATKFININSNSSSIYRLKDFLNKV